MLLHFTAPFLHFASCFPFIHIFYFSPQPDGSPGYVTSVSVIEPGMRLPPVYVDGQISSSLFWALPRNLPANNPKKLWKLFRLSILIGLVIFFDGGDWES